MSISVKGNFPDLKNQFHIQLRTQQQKNLRSQKHLHRHNWTLHLRSQNRRSPDHLRSQDHIRRQKHLRSQKHPGVAQVAVSLFLG